MFFQSKLESFVEDEANNTTYKIDTFEWLCQYKAGKARA